ncbi:MAG: two-component regulator propeller domain-containing protein [Bacteroidota bacterium]
MKPQWIDFNTANSKLSDNHINALFVDADGSVWAATANGASWYRERSWSSIVEQLSWSYSSSGLDSTGNRVPVTETSCNVTSVTQGPAGDLWFGLAGGGVARYNTKSPSYPVWTRYTHDDYSLMYDVILSVAAVRPRGDIWIATLDGVAHFIPASFGRGIWQSHASDSAHFPQVIVRTVAVNPLDNGIWFGVGDYGLVYYDGDAKWTKFPVNPPYYLPITCIAFDVSNTLWVGKWEGASSFDANTGWWKQDYVSGTTHGHLPYGPVNAITTDYVTTRWFGTNKGLVRLSDTAWTTFNRANTQQLPSDTITALTYDMSGNLWIGTINGIAVYIETGTRF